MFLDILNFIFVYFISGLILSLFIKKVTKNIFDKELVFILGYGISPLLISLILYYLYLFFPEKSWIFYGIIIYNIFIILFIFCKKELKTIKFQKKCFSIFFRKIKTLNIFKKILLAFVLFMVVFTVIRNVAYPTTYTDAVEYLQQGFVYSQDHSHEKFNKREAFSDFNKNNPLGAPENEYKMNKAIRPALPIFYSFFYINETPTSLHFFSIKFIYTYYFLLCLVIFVYIINKFKPKNILIGLTLLLSCYFFTKLSYSNYKAIITAFLSLSSLFILYKLTKSKNWHHAIFLGVLCGLMSYINYTGLIISGILFLLGLFFYKSNLREKILVVLMILLTFAFFSGGEIGQYQDFIFKKSFISFENQEGTFESSEFISRLGSENKNQQIKEDGNNREDTSSSIFNQKLDTLITKKLQAFTQIQFFGFVFWLFLIVLLLLIIKRRKISDFSKINLAFITLFFFIFFDPFFLNPHKFAYVLSLGYRYTAILSVFIAIFITLNYQTILNILKRIEIKYLKGAIISSALFLPPIREFFNNQLFTIIKKTAITTNPDSYYLNKIDLALLLLAFLSLLLFVFILFYQQKYDQKKNSSLINTIFLTIFFIFPSVFTLNNNQDILNTFKYSLQVNSPEKIAKSTKSTNEKETFQAIGYINKKIEKNAPILLDIRAGSNFCLHTKNNQRIFNSPNQISSFDDFYFFSDKKTFPAQLIKKSCLKEKEFGDFSVFKCQ